VFVLSLVLLLRGFEGGCVGDDDTLLEEVDDEVDS